MAVALVEQGINVWFDDWELRPGDSITGGIEAGLSQADVFVFLWSEAASSSNWVGTEIRAYVRRRVDKQTLRIVPVMLDHTALPVLVADYRGFQFDSASDLRRIAGEIVGRSDLKTVAERLQRRLHELAARELAPEDSIRFLVCPKCASKRISRNSHYDGYEDSIIYFAMCEDCGWGEAKKARTNVP